MLDPLLVHPKSHIGASRGTPKRPNIERGQNLTPTGCGSRKRFKRGIYFYEMFILY